MPFCQNNRSTLIVDSSNGNMKEGTMKLMEGNVLQEDVFQCLSRKNEFYRVVLMHSEILLQSTKDHSTTERYSINDLFGCHALRNKKSVTNGSAFLCFYLYPRSKKASLSSTRYRTKVPLVFEIRKSGNSFQNNLDIALTWKKDALGILCQRYPKWQLHKPKTRKIPVTNRNYGNNNDGTNENEGNESDESIEIFYEAERSQDPLDHNVQKGDSPYSFATFLPFLRRYVVILNPKSGQGKTITIFQEKVSPILTEANVKVDLLVTEHPGHARNMMATADLSEVDGIVTVGGDGLLYEVVNGLRCREDTSRIANIPVGVVAGGSGNGLARSIAHYSGEADDYLKNPVLSTSLAAARGKILPVNLVEVELDNKKIYSFLSSGWGLLSDIDVESEVIRGLGETRFTLWSFLRLASLRSYKGKLSFIPWDVTDDPNSANKKLGYENGKEQVLEADFVNIYSTCQSHIGTELMFAPNATPNDGVIHLTYIERSAGRGTATAFLLALDRGDHINVSGVKYLTVKEFTLTGEGTLPGNLTIDGERVTGHTMTVRMAPKPLHVFSL